MQAHEQLKEKGVNGLNTDSAVNFPGLTKAGLQAKLNESWFFEVTTDGVTETWYPVQHLDLLRSYYKLDPILSLQCRVIVNFYWGGFRLGGDAPSWVWRKLQSMTLVDFETSIQYTKNSIMIFPWSLFEKLTGELNEIGQEMINSQAKTAK